MGITRKLGSQRGASMSMALMLLLVCSVVTSVVLAAATAAVGRQGRLEAMDRSYYNVTSAAGLFWDELRGGEQTVTVTRECDAIDSGGGAYGSLSGWRGSLGPAISTDSPVAISGESATLFEIAAYDMLFDPSRHTLSFDASAARSFDAATVEGSIDAGLLEPREPSSQAAAYDSFTVSAAGHQDVLVRVSRDAQGGLSFVFGERDGDDPGEFRPGTYKCTMRVSASVDESGCRARRTGAGTYHLTWVTKVTWDTENLRLGGDPS